METEAAEDAAVYEREMRWRSLVDFDDLILLPVRLLESRLDITARYRDRWRFISVDEYQDVDDLQYRLVRLLAPGGGNICVIGDPDQAIYGFRGADVGFFLRFERDYPCARRVRLRHNYRSGRGIVEGAGEVISRSDLHMDRAIEAAARDETRIVVHDAPSEAAEAEFVVRTMEALLGGHSFFSVDTGRADSARDTGYAFSDFAVLHRTAAQADEIAVALGRSGIPFERRAHGLLCDREDVAAVTAAMAASRPGAAVADMLREAVASLGGSAGECAALLAPLARRHGTDLDAFLRALALESDADLWDPRAERVSLLTLHASKGLEFRVVFLTGCEDGLLPLRFGGEPASSMEEERRLFYVGMTRARERLYFCRARRRLLRGALRDMQPSPFLKDIEERLLERAREQVRRRVPRPEGDQLTLL
jgi:DNA helicase-2/ATP-dependent DNA helicase PcrA